MFGWTSVCYDRLPGLLVQTMRKLDDAAAHFEDALTFRRKAGYRPELAWSLSDYADMLVERDAEAALDLPKTCLFLANYRLNSPRHKMTRTHGTQFWSRELRRFLTER